MSIEYRAQPGPVAVRESRGKGPMIRGYAAVFNEWTTLYQDESVVIRERISPGAFVRALRERQDVRALFNHDPTLLLGRTRSGTCRLWFDSHGLAYEVDPPDNSIGRDCVTIIRRGDVRESSFAFSIRPGGQTVARSLESKTGRRIVERDVKDVDLFDVSPVTYPAYKGTTVGLREGRSPADAARMARMGRLHADFAELMAS